MPNASVSMKLPGTEKDPEENYFGPKTDWYHSSSVLLYLMDLLWISYWPHQASMQVQFSIKLSKETQYSEEFSALMNDLSGKKNFSPKSSIVENWLLQQTPHIYHNQGRAPYPAPARLMVAAVINGPGEEFKTFLHHWGTNWKPLYRSIVNIPPSWSIPARKLRHFRRGPLFNPINNTKDVRMWMVLCLYIYWYYYFVFLWSSSRFA